MWKSILPTMARSLRWLGRVETVAAEVETAVLAESRIVAARILIQDLEHARIHALMQRIHLPDLSGRQRLRRAIRQLEAQDALPQRVGGNGAHLRDAAGIGRAAS